MDELPSTRTPVAGHEAANGRPESPPERFSVGIVLNPKHPATLRAYADLVPKLRRAGAHCRSMTTSVERPGRWQADQLIDWGADAVVILGGDGTIRAAASVLAEAGTPTFIVPTGTANVLSRHIGLRSPRHAIVHCVRTVASVIHAGSTNLRRIPINSAEVQRSDGSRQRTEFISLAGIGGDARAVAQHHSAPGLFGYAWGAARALFAAGITVSTEVTAGSARTAAGPVWAVMASKVARPAGPIAVFPQAHIDQEAFSVLTVGPFPRPVAARCRAWAGIAAACLRGNPAAHALMDYRILTEMSASVETPAPVQLDGDLIGDCVELRVCAGGTTLLVSAPAS